MIIRRVTISKKQLCSIPEDERSLMILLGHWDNESTVLHKLLIYSYTDKDNDVERKVHTSQALIIARIYTGKIFEGWRLLEKTFFVSKLSQEYEKMIVEKGRVALTNLKKYFGKKNLIAEIRNNYSFHYTPEEVIKQLDIFEDDQKFEMFLGNDMANSNHYFSEEIVSKAMLKRIDPSDDLTAMTKFMDELLMVSSWFNDFVGHCMLAILNRYFRPEDFKVENIDIPNPPNIHDISMPWFVVR